MLAAEVIIDCEKACLCPRMRGNSLDRRLLLYMSLMGPYMVALLGALLSAVSLPPFGPSPNLAESWFVWTRFRKILSRSKWLTWDLRWTCVGGHRHHHSFPHSTLNGCSCHTLKHGSFTSQQDGLVVAVPQPRHHHPPVRHDSHPSDTGLTMCICLPRLSRWRLHASGAVVHQLLGHCVR